MTRGLKTKLPDFAYLLLKHCSELGCSSVQLMQLLRRVVHEKSADVNALFKKGRQWSARLACGST
jgi:hypothetical protein